MYRSGEFSRCLCRNRDRLLLRRNAFHRRLGRRGRSGRRRRWWPRGGRRSARRARRLSGSDTDLDGPHFFAMSRADDVGLIDGHILTHDLSVAQPKLQRHGMIGPSPDRATRAGTDRDRVWGATYPGGPPPPILGRGEPLYVVVPVLLLQSLTLFACVYVALRRDRGAAGR